MSLNEQQIRAIVKDELRKIIDAGLMYTESCKPQEMGKQGTPSLQPSSTPVPTSSPNNVLGKFPEEQRQHIALKDGFIVMTEFVSKERWMEINDTAESLGYKWVRNEKDAKLSRWEKTQ
jgi:hypothetical protein